MMRNMIRRGIRARAETAPTRRIRPRRTAQPSPTFGHDRVVPGIPPAATPEEDGRLLREVARNVVAEMIRTSSEQG